MSTSNFGSRVIGEEAYTRSLREQKAGADVFGKRVVGDLREGTADELAKNNSQFGPKVIMNAEAADHTGKKGATVAVEDLENILTENPTFFDSLFENELARSGGPRKDALEVFAVFEVGPKGADRAHVMRKINGLLGKTANEAAVNAENVSKAIKREGEMAQRDVENRALQDADRIKGLAEREENLAKIRKHNPELLKQQPEGGTGGDSPSADSKTDREGSTAKAPSSDKKESDVKPETQARTKRPSQKKKK